MRPRTANSISHMNMVVLYTHHHTNTQCTCPPSDARHQIELRAARAEATLNVSRPHASAHPRTNWKVPNALPEFAGNPGRQQDIFKHGIHPLRPFRKEPMRRIHLVITRCHPTPITISIAQATQLLTLSFRHCFQ